ncbi:hypothetical protein L1987_25179 [Smallanthus sonchifolius]|uniref:Uncharacterized protein n=1 Tax=Smallanthus sonchifolius TaxID=185202 RepID=A0ACB9IMP5_9ASTR|nr:hypothetical protein L1987_25179 [Smallanthus sonchifolius]
MSRFGTAKTLISTVGSIAAAAMVARSVCCDYLPLEFRDYVYLGFRKFINKFSTQLTMVIYEFEGFSDNEIYNATQLYLADRISSDIHRLKRGESITGELGRRGREGICCTVLRGTGKSSLIAAMANHLNFDVYDLELTDIKSNSELRRWLVATANRSVLVVEDIDCSVELHDRVQVEAAKVEARKSQRRSYEKESKVTLSGFLNFIDGLWSSYGDERIMIFTTNRKDKLDPALIRPGRMDDHIHMSYCTPSAFQLLASNYLSVTEHNHFEEIENLIRHVEVTPAEVAEQLLKDDDPDTALGGLIEFFDVKRKEIEEAKERLKEEELAATENEKKQQEDEMNN